MSKSYDLVILGAGIGGYVAAIRAAQLGMHVALVEKEKLGGVCLHQGCIPTKTMLKSAELYHEMKQSERFGIKVSEMQFDFSLVQTRKQKVVDKLHQGIQQLLAQEKLIDIYYGKGTILGASIFSPQSGTISVELSDRKESVILLPQYLLIATGSRPRPLSGWRIDGEEICFSDHLIHMENLPSSVAIIGGGVIGVEWASLLNDFNVKVSVIETADRLLPFEDEEISESMKQSLEKRGVSVYTGIQNRPERVIDANAHRYLQVSGEQIPAEKVILSVGRVPNSEEIGLQNTEVQVDPEGYIQVNDYMQTAEKHIYAIGDVVGGYQLAHVALHEALIAVEHMAGFKVNPLDKQSIPRCIYSRPEVASMGWTEQDAKKAGFEIKVGKFPFQSLGKAVVSGKSEGFIKMVSDQNTDDLLGVHMIGTPATELISIASLAKVVDATPWEITQSVFPHPTVSEAFGEVSFAVDGIPIHSFLRKKKG